MMKLARLALLFLLTLTSAAQAHPGLVLWQVVAEKIERARDYQVKCHFKSSKVDLHLDYLASKNKIRTRIIAPSANGVGSLSLFDPSIAHDKVLIRFPAGGVISRAVDHEEISGRPFHRNLLVELVKEIGSQVPTPLAERELTLYQTNNVDGSAVHVRANREAEIVRIERYEGKTLIEEIDFRDYRWNTGQVPNLNP